ncbi:sporulation protein SsgA [Streptomyces filamentosus]|uniref:sporulation protein SsgA n=1 Tax=Streptomyces filamentosus TaxID=67294 RepID=UPI0037CD1EF5
MAKDIEKAEETRLAGESSAAGLKGWLWHRVKPYTPPWLVAGGVGVAGAAAYLPWGGSAFAGVGLTLTSVGLSATTWYAAKGMGKARRLHSTITVAAASGWLTCAALAGPVSGPLPHLYGMGAPALAMSWNIRGVVRRAGGAEGESDQSGLLESIGLAKLKIGKGTVTETGQARFAFMLEKGSTTQELTKALPNLESAVDMRPGGFRIEPDPTSHRKGVLVGVPLDPLSGTTWYPGPSSPGGSITEPLVIGRYDDTTPLEVKLLKGIHYLIAGVTGSGKTEAAMDVLAEILSRRDVIVWLADPVKQGLDLGEIFPACDWVALSPDAVESMAEAIVASVPIRAAWLRAHNYRKWESASAEVQTDPQHSCSGRGACGCPGLPYLVGWFEEAAATFSRVDEETFTEACQQIRATGASLFFSLQRPSHDQMPTTVRASLPSALVFGMDERDETMALPTDVLDAGAHPGQWGPGHPGYCYLAEAGLPIDRQVSPARTYASDPSVLGWVASALEAYRMQAGPVMQSLAASIAGSAYGSATSPALTTHEAEEAPAMTFLSLPDEDDEDDFLLDLDPSEELPEDEHGDDVPLVPVDTRPELTTEEAREVLEQLLDEMHASGARKVTPAQLVAHSDQIGRKASWIKAAVRSLRAEGRLVDDLKGEPTGTYRIVPRESARVLQDA